MYVELRRQTQACLHMCSFISAYRVVSNAHFSSEGCHFLRWGNMEAMDNLVDQVESNEDHLWSEVEFKEVFSEIREVVADMCQNLETHQHLEGRRGANIIL